MYVELWEIGLAEFTRGEKGEGRGELESWLAALYAAPAPKRELFESYVHDAPIEPLPSPLSRSRLSWWALLFMAPELPVDAPRSEEHTSELQSQSNLVCRLLLEKKKNRTRLRSKSNLVSHVRNKKKDKRKVIE